MFYAYSTQNISAFKDCDLIKLILFTHLSRAFPYVRLGFYFLTIKYMAEKNMTTLIHFRVPTLRCGEAPVALPTIAFVPSVQMSTL